VLISYINHGKGEIPASHLEIYERKRIKEMKGFTVITVYSGLYVLYLSLLLLRSKVLLACENTPINNGENRLSKMIL
jgi:hypothetical protein